MLTLALEKYNALDRWVRVRPWFAVILGTLLIALGVQVWEMLGALLVSDPLPACRPMEWV
jgi:hypothetical protein